MLEDRDLGTLVFDIEASGTVEAVKVRFGDNIWIDQEETSEACPGQKHGDGAAGATASDDGDAECLETLDGFLANGESLSLKVCGVGSRVMAIRAVTEGVMTPQEAAVLLDVQQEEFDGLFGATVSTMGRGLRIRGG